jgi:hypothetical protein
VSHGGVRPVAPVDHHVVAEDPGRPEQLPEHPFDHEEPQGRPRVGAPMVPLAIMGPHHHASHGSEHVLAEGRERCRGEGKRPPAEGGAGPVERLVHQVNGVGLAVGVQTVARDLASWAVERRPPTRDRHDHLLGNGSHRPHPEVHGQAEHQDDRTDNRHRIEPGHGAHDPRHPQPHEWHPQAGAHDGHNGTARRDLGSLSSLHGPCSPTRPPSGTLVRTNRPPPRGGRAVNAATTCERRRTARRATHVYLSTLLELPP